MKIYFKKRLLNYPLKLRFFFPIFIAIVIAIFGITYFAINETKSYVNESIKNNLTLEVKTLMEMLERERTLKIQRVNTFLEVANDTFYDSKLVISNEKIDMSVEDQISNEIHTVKLNKWMVDGEELHSSAKMVEKINSLLGCSVTIFQKMDDGYVRMSTTVERIDGSNAQGTYISNDSPVIKSVESGNTYLGRALVVDDWYITAYEPISHQDKVVGMLYVGVKESDLTVLRDIFSGIQIGKSGYPFVFDENSTMIIHPESEGKNFSSEPFMKKIIGKDKGLLSNVKNDEKWYIAFEYSDNFKYYVAATVNKKIEMEKITSGIIFSSLLLAIIIIVIISIIVYFVGIETFQKYSNLLEDTEKDLATSQEALKRSERLATMGQLSAGIAHEVNNPLGIVIMYSNLLLEETDSESEMYKDLKTIVTQADRCKNILSGLLNFARKNEVHLEKISAKALVRGVVSNVIIPSEVELNIIDPEDDIEISVDPAQVIQVFTNLIKNAIDAMKQKGKIDLITEFTSSNIRITVKDNGPGIAEEIQGKLFEPFFSTKKIGKGTGLGLAVCYGIVKMHKGKIKIESNDNPDKGETGSSFVVELPVI
ncbi:MAG: Cache 3/Cache 2 fusion domain-containing protein [Candidatus Delongbacteria bacterium]|jgi:signal transduction histidine kinase|nr:Cache 3/Cache 2 fusion domain-containing protein [Candidatus Delongbacteria bacterium]